MEHLLLNYEIRTKAKFKKLTFLGKKRERLKNKTEDDENIMIEHQMVRIVSQSVMCA